MSRTTSLISTPALSGCRSDPHRGHPNPLMRHFTPPGSCDPPAITPLHTGPLFVHTLALLPPRTVCGAGGAPPPLHSHCESRGFLYPPTYPNKQLKVHPCCHLLWVMLGDGGDITVGGPGWGDTQGHCDPLSPRQPFPGVLSPPAPPAAGAESSLSLATRWQHRAVWGQGCGTRSGTRDGDRAAEGDKGPQLVTTAGTGGASTRERWQHSPLPGWPLMSPGVPSVPPWGGEGSRCTSKPTVVYWGGGHRAK